MEETIDLREYFYTLKKKFWIIALTVIIFGLISGVVSFFLLEPVYESSTTLIVNKEVENETTQMTTTEDLNYTQKLAVTYGEIIKSRSVIRATLETVGADLTYDELAKSISVTNVADTQIIKVSVKNTNPVLATKICNTIPTIFDKEVKRIMKASGTEVIDEAEVPENPIKPNKIMNVAIASVLGAMISIFIIFLLEALNNKVKTPKDIEEKLGIPVFGVIPKF